LLNLNNVIYIDNFPKLDLHGYDRDAAFMLVNDFINDNIIMKKNILVIVHGIGSGILKKATHDALSKNKHVIAYKLFNYNVGCTIVEIKFDK
jgi:DNA mismatch repair protein MutS2